MLPKSRSGSKRLQALQKFCHEARLARGPGAFFIAQSAARSCTDCKFTCHPECRHLIQLDCSQQGGPSQDRPSPESTLTPVFSQGVNSKQGLPSLSIRKQKYIHQ
ncbi:ras association domain-containing protein 5 isoform X2 [Prionailurus iriomotensis]